VPDPRLEPEFADPTRSGRTRGDGRFLPPRTFNERFQRLREAAGLPYARPHDQHHFGATAMLAAKVPVKVVSERLGHAGTAVTLGAYAHVLEEQPKEVAEFFEALLGAPAEAAEGTAEGVS
jgi:integrase